MPNIVFVNEQDEIIGSGPRKEALAKGIIHRIIRVFIFNSKEEMLLQKRSQKVPYPGLWDQSVGGHVDEGEDYLTAAIRETKEEVGISDIKLKEVGKYFKEYLDRTADGGKPRKRFNMLYLAEYDGVIDFNKEEIEDIKWVSLPDLENWIEKSPRDFTFGFLEAYKFYKSNT